MFKNIKSSGIIFFSGLLYFFNAHAAEKELPRLAVFNLKAERGIDEGLVKLLNELLLTEFEKTGKYEVLGWSDIIAMLDLEREKQVSGCTDDKCLVEIGGALGVEYIAVSNMGRIGDYYLINMKVIDVQRAKAVTRASREVEGVENALIRAIKGSVKDVVKEKNAEKEIRIKTTMKSTPAIEPLKETVEVKKEKRASVLPYILAGASALMVGGGIYFGLRAKSDTQGAASAVDNVRQDRNEKAAHTHALVANVLFSVAATSIIGAAVLYILEK